MLWIVSSKHADAMVAMTVVDMPQSISQYTVVIMGIGRLTSREKIKNSIAQKEVHQIWGRMFWLGEDSGRSLEQDISFIAGLIFSDTTNQGIYSLCVLFNRDSSMADKG